ncbi:receptor-interacting serine/threonine-protein kinase 2-like [Branchiostoma floridae x Branchiostoma belcheri]
MTYSFILSFVKISDFGLWKWTDARIGSETSPAGATRTHAPPEYYTDVNRPPTDKFDVYSFGVLLWEIVKRNPPFPYAACGSPAVPTDQRADPAGSDPSDLETVNQLIQSCCSHNPDDRPDFKECGDRLSDVTGRYELVHFLKAVIYLQKEKARRK